MIPVRDEATNPACPVCAGARTGLRYPLARCDLYACSSCSHLFALLKEGTGPEEYPSDYFDDRHREYFENPDAPLFERTLERLERHWKARGNVLDVGCGTGNWLAFLQSKSYRPYGIETSTAAAELARRRGLEVSCTDLADYEPSVEMDGMISWYVLEHIENVREFVERSASVLKPGAVAAFATVDSGSLIYRLGMLLHRATLGRLRAPLQRICEIHHQQHFSERSLATLLEGNGFQVAERFTAPLPLDSVKASGLQKLLVRIVYALASLNDSHFIQVVIATRVGEPGAPGPRPGATHRPRQDR